MVGIRGVRENTYYRRSHILDVEDKKKKTIMITIYLGAAMHKTCFIHTLFYSSLQSGKVGDTISVSWIMKRVPGDEVTCLR